MGGRFLWKELCGRSLAGSLDLPISSFLLITGETMFRKNCDAK